MRCEFEKMVLCGYLKLSFYAGSTNGQLNERRNTPQQSERSIRNGGSRKKPNATEKHQKISSFENCGVVWLDEALLLAHTHTRTGRRT